MDTIIAPIISEKSMNDAGLGKFTFRVERSSNKSMIKKEVEAKFKVNVIKVSTMVVKGKSKKTGKRRVETKTADWKKALVVLKKGQKIDLFEAGGQQK